MRRARISAAAIWRLKLANSLLFVPLPLTIVRQLAKVHQEILLEGVKALGPPSRGGNRYE